MLVIDTRMCSLTYSSPFLSSRFLIRRIGQSRTRTMEAHTAGAYLGFRSMKQLRVLLLPLDGILVHRKVIPQQYVAGTHLYTWVEKDDVGQSISSKETTRCRGLCVKPLTFISEVQSDDHYTTAPPLIRRK